MNIKQLFARDKAASNAVYGAFFVFFSMGMSLILLGSVLPALSTAYNLNYEQSGLLLSMQSVGYWFAALICGTLALRLGDKIAYLILLSTMIIGFAMLLVWGNPYWLMLALAFAGMTKGGIVAYNNALVNFFSGGSVAVLNILHASFAAGACLAPLVVMLCDTIGGGWRVAIGLCIALLALAWLWISRVQLHIYGEKTSDEPERAPFGFAKLPLFWLSTVFIFCYQFVEGSLMGWLTTYFISTGVIADSMAQVLTSLMWGALLVGRLGCSLSGARATHLLMGLSTGVLVFLGGLVVADTQIQLLLTTAGLGLCLSGIAGTAIANARTVFAQYRLAIGAYITLSSFGAMLGPALVGIFAEAYDMRTGMAVLLVGTVIMVVLGAVNWWYQSHHGENA